MCQLEVYLWMYFKAYLQTHCLFAWHHGEIKRNQPRPQKINCRPPQVWFILGRNFQTPEGTTCICTNNSTQVLTPWDHAGRRRLLSPRDERTLVWKVQINPRTTAKDLVKMLEETVTKVSISTVKWVLYRHNLKGRSARKKSLLQNRHKKPDNSLQLHMGTKIVPFGEMSSGLIKQK